MTQKQLALFGGAEPWSPVDWTSSDDQVRGGKSQSYISANPFEPVARFYGNLDIETLGGAGFASQRTTGENRCYDLKEYDGIELEIEKSDGKRYTFNVKDTLLPPNEENGREVSTINYEYDFCVSQETTLSDSTRIKIPWSAFTATYRGREQEDAPELTGDNIKRFSIMMRSFFGTQQGPFSLSIRSISAYKDRVDESFAAGILGSPKLLMPIVLLGGTFLLTKFLIAVIGRHNL